MDIKKLIEKIIVESPNDDLIKHSMALLKKITKAPARVHSPDSRGLIISLVSRDIFSIEFQGDKVEIIVSYPITMKQYDKYFHGKSEEILNWIKRNLPYLKIVIEEFIFSIEEDTVSNEQKFTSAFNKIR